MAVAVRGRRMTSIRGAEGARWPRAWEAPLRTLVSI